MKLFFYYSRGGFKYPFLHDCKLENDTLKFYDYQKVTEKFSLIKINNDEFISSNNRGTEIRFKRIPEDVEIIKHLEQDSTSSYEEYVSDHMHKYKARLNKWKSK